MKRYSSILLAASSLLWALNAPGEVRPHYGGTLHIAMREQCPALDPPVSPACANISRLIFETLVQLDRQGHPQPLLAISWQSEPGSQRWRFLLRSGVSFQDGTSLDSSLVAASLRNAHPDWKVLPVGESVIVETGSPDPNLPAELALAGNAIVRRGGAHLLGTGPFAIQAWDPGKRLSLVANDRYSASRPFLDGIEVDFSRNARDQMLALDIGKADVADVAPEDIRRARADGRSVVSSEPAELMALLFAADPRSEDETHLRTALALGLDTASMNDVVLQGGGEPASSLLPNWLSGYAFAFGSGRNLERARQERMLAKHAAPLSLCYDTGDAVALVIAERVVLNAKDAGISLQLATSSACDVKLLRIPLNSLDPRVALHELAKGLNLPAPGFANGSVEELYNAEKTLLQTHRVIPLLHLRSAVALRSNVHGFAIFPGGTWDLSNLWLSTERP